MTRISAISSQTPTMTTQQRENQEKVAAGVGGVAGLSTSATKMAGKKGLQTQVGEKAYQNTIHMLTETNKAVINSSEKVTGLWNTFKNDIKRFSNDIITKLQKFKDSKFIGPIIKSPIIKNIAGFLGGALAFFVLVTGINKAFNTGELAFDDLRHQYNEMRNM